jgi:hypothetical protein
MISPSWDVRQDKTLRRVIIVGVMDKFDVSF